MVYKAVWNVRFPGVIVFVEMHFLVFLQDLSLGILQPPDYSSGVYLALELMLQSQEIWMNHIFF